MTAIAVIVMVTVTAWFVWVAWFMHRMATRSCGYEAREDTRPR